MKNLILFFVGVLMSLPTFAQNSTLNFYRGKTKTIGAEFISSINNKFLLGFGVGANRKSLDGEEHVYIMDPAVYGVLIEEDRASFYGIFGYSLTERFSVYTNVGYGTKISYHNGYDRFNISLPYPTYFTSVTYGGRLIVGANAAYRVSNKLNFIFGYDNYSQGKIGIGLRH